jgi:hypothetical protein
MCCPDCGRRDQWPQPEYGCQCGEVVRLPVDHRALAESSAPPAPHSSAVIPVVALPPSPPAPPSSRMPSDTDACWKEPANARLPGLAH